jgi:hypothetical protein
MGLRADGDNVERNQMGILRVEPGREPKQGLFKTITITCCDRPEYLRRVLTSLLRNNLDEWTIFLGVEPGPVYEQVIEVLLGSLEGKARFEIIRNRSRLGVSLNPYNLLSRAFEAGSAINLYLEEDVIVSPDVIRVAEWFSRIDHDGIACLNLMHGSCGGEGHFSSPPPHFFVRTRRFNSLGIILTRDQWQSHFQPHWFDLPKGWDWSVLRRIQLTSGLRTLQPLMARANHIGRDGGTYCSPDFHDRVFSTLEMCDATVGLPYKIVDEHYMGESVRRSETSVLEGSNSPLESGVSMIIAICSCHKNVAKRNAIRESWASELPPNVTARFFVGNGPDSCAEEDTLCLEAPDEYDGLPAKVMAFFRHALDHVKFDYLFKCDDDTFVAVPRLLELLEESPCLVGNYRLLTDGFASGGAGYLLGRRWVEAVLRDSSIPPTGCEDVLLTQAAIRAGALPMVSHRLTADMSDFPALDNNTITAHWCGPTEMRMIHAMLMSPHRLIKVLHANWQDNILLFDDGRFTRRSVLDGGTWDADGIGYKLKWLEWDEETIVPSKVDSLGSACGIPLYTCANAASEPTAHS